MKKLFAGIGVVILGVVVLLPLACKNNSTPSSPVVPSASVPGTSWKIVGKAGFSSSGGAAYTSLAFDNGTPYVAYEEGTDGKAAVMKYDGNQWVPVGNPGFSAGVAHFTSLALPNGSPYVAYQDNHGNPGKATVLMFDGSNWVPVGSAGFSADPATYTSLAFGNGTPYLAYQDIGYSGATGYSFKGILVKFDGSAWVTVGNAGFSNGPTSYPSLAFDNGTPYVAYQDGSGTAGWTTVMKYDGNAWVTVGNAGFALVAGGNLSGYLSLAINNGVPYLAFSDAGNSLKATVMKYDGSNWVTLGGAGFSAGKVYYLSLAINAGAPYVSYYDVAGSGKATVMKYDGSAWVTVGNAGFTGGAATYTSLAFNNGVPYVAFVDGVNNYDATVMAFQ